MKRIHAFVIMIGLLAFSSSMVVSARAAVECGLDEPCYFAYDETGSSYSLWPGPFPTYWQTTYKGEEVKVTTATITVSVQGFPSQYSTDLIVDGKTVGSVAGGGTAKFQVKGDEIHSYQVSSYITGKSGERFYSKGTSWTSEKGKEVEVTTYEQAYLPYYYYYYPDCYDAYCYYYYDWYSYYPYYQPTTKTVTQPFDQSYTFRYETEYELRVTNEFGGGVSQTGWHAKDSSVTLSTDPTIEISKDTRSIFVAWNLNGNDVKNTQVTVKMDQPYTAAAKYKRQYTVEVRSDYGNPSGSGWYDEGSKATIQVEKELALESFWGALGGKRVFDHWIGVGSSVNIAEITVDSPKLTAANWRTDLSTPYTVIGLLALIIVAIAAIAVFMAFVRPRMKQSGVETSELKGGVTEEDPMKIIKRRYASGEITRQEFERMKKDLETQTS